MTSNKTQKIKSPSLSKANAEAQKKVVQDKQNTLPLDITGLEVVESPINSHRRKEVLSKLKNT